MKNQIRQKLSFVYLFKFSNRNAPSRSMDISLPSTSASTPWAGDKLGNGGSYRTPKVETLEWAQAEGVRPLTLPTTGVTEGADTPLEVALEAAFADFSRYVDMLRFTLVTSDGNRYP